MTTVQSLDVVKHTQGKSDLGDTLASRREKGVCVCVCVWRARACVFVYVCVRARARVCVHVCM